jgi:hypothetical protein
MDVHAETIAVAVAEEGGEARSLGTIPNRSESVRKRIAKLGLIGATPRSWPGATRKAT